MPKTNTTIAISERERNLNAAEQNTRDIFGTIDKLDAAIAEREGRIPAMVARVAEAKQAIGAEATRAALNGTGIQRGTSRDTLRDCQDDLNAEQAALDALRERREEARAQLAVAAREHQHAFDEFGRERYEAAIDEFLPAAAAFLDAARRLYGFALTLAAAQTPQWLGKLTLPDPRNAMRSLGSVVEQSFDARGQIMNVTFSPNPETAAALEPYERRRHLLNQAVLEALKLREEKKAA